MMPRKGQDRLLRAALKYAEHGWSVFPIKPRGKEPLTAHGFKDATRNEDQIRVWWTDTPTANIGIATGAVSGIVVVDVDGGGAEEGLRELGAQVPTLTSLTAKGRHLLFKHPGQEIQNRTRLRPDLDVRADGGYFISPPSVHPSGQRYQWDNDHGMGWGTALAPLPEKLLKELTSNGRRRTAEPLPDVIPEGERNATLASLAGSMRRRGATESAILAALEVENARCNPPLPDREVAMIANSVSRYDPEPYELNEEYKKRHLHSYSSFVPDAKKQEENRLSSFNSYTSDSLALWPSDLTEAAYHGLVGEFVRTIGPHTEADPAAVVAQFLVMAGNVFGRRAFYPVEADRHFPNENLLIVGQTSSGKKGTAWGQARRLFCLTTSPWVENCIVSGLSSGEGLIWGVRDEITKTEAIKEKGRLTGEYQTVVTDPGVEDKRLLVLETEFGKVLTVLEREGNTLSPVMRQAWESGNLNTLTKTSPAKATGAHISIVAHCTPDELRRLKRKEVANGFLNRFLVVCARRSKVLPDGGSLRDDQLQVLAERLSSVLFFADGVGELTRDTGAKDLWYDVYPKLISERPGLLGAVTSRAPAHVLRLSCIYALLDESSQIQTPHLEAALAVWRYVEQSVEFLFGADLGDPVADQIYREVATHPDGMSKTDIFALFKGNRSATELNRALAHLQASGLVYCDRQKTGGRPREVWRGHQTSGGIQANSAVSALEKETQEEVGLRFAGGPSQDTEAIEERLAIQEEACV